MLTMRRYFDLGRWGSKTEAYMTDVARSQVLGREAGQKQNRMTTAGVEPAIS